MRAGSIAIWAGGIWHGSGPNNSGATLVCSIQFGNLRFSFKKCVRINVI